MKKLIYLFLLMPSILFSQWTQLPTGTNMSFFSSSFVNPDTGWAAGGSVYYTSNGGNNWILFYDTPAGDRLDCMMFKNAFTGWAGSYQGWIYKTTDGGHNWSRVRVWNPRVLDIFFTDLNTGWAVGESGNCKKTTDGGNTWNINGSFGSYELDCIWFKNNYTGFIGGYKQFASTTNSGLNWNIAFMPDNLISAIYFVNNNTGWALGYKIINSSSCSALYILKTQNGGLNWNVVCSDSCNYGYHTRILDAHFVTAEIGYYCGYYAYAPPPAFQDHRLMKTANGGINWSNIYLPGWFNSLETLDFVNSQTGYVAGYSGYIYKTTNGGPVGIVEINKYHPSEFSLSQNYPNPFNPATKIKFSIPPSRGARGVIKLVIYDILSREVATLVSEQLHPGTYQVEWDGSNYPSGVYFYKLVSSEYTETRKMVLVK